MSRVVGPMDHTLRASGLDRMDVRRRFFTKIDMRPGECWTWTAGRNNRGYGVFTDAERRQQLAHRIAYRYFRGPIPEGLVIDHRCGNRACCHPMHLAAVTQYENIMRGDSPAAWNGIKEFCIRGHPFDVDNTRRLSGCGRRCRACHRLDRTRRRVQVAASP